MKMNPAFLLPILILLMISAYQSYKSMESNVPRPTTQESKEMELQRIRAENDTLKAKISDDQNSNERYIVNLSSTLNLSFKIIHAMGQKDFDYLKSISAPNVTFSKFENRVYFPYGGKIIAPKLLKPIELGNLEYRFSTYMNGESEIIVGFAYYWDDSHSTIELYFVKGEDSWIFNGFITNA
ncbi:hypothetical protein E5161_07220 [Cohnella pontilimi]|uniref:Uncharacterized protein n=1 Tax=Cohnella pontilimi TaxID=2564100 RepID=A0A4U0FCM3_9BACL|nr:hypothetical protein [Cohnella pontilimi]TJY42636.1 hypothetical protein E5161_07220 [Cohnella pontilimi]